MATTFQRLQSLGCVTLPPSLGLLLGFLLAVALSVDILGLLNLVVKITFQALQSFVAPPHLRRFRIFICIQRAYLESNSIEDFCFQW
ncbi:uncharacterized protein J3D65DRAFT_631920 [Phyllosticta citribraziliensis]|uniref:Uncharacterized protein n=1 Tax=Phyllosticta citribraziliensis TaxID=989973 RepID=A0ABR1LFG5_9PEZI